MLNNASLFLALRYLRPKRSFVSIITIISVLGITLGVGVLIVVISVMKGFEVDFRKLLIGFEPHVLMLPEPDSGLARAPGDPQPSKWQDMRDLALKLPGVTSATPFVAGMVFLKVENHELSAIEIYGMPDKHAEPLVAKLSKQLVKDLQTGKVQGSLDMDGDNIVLSDDLMNSLGLNLGDKVAVISSLSFKRKAEYMLQKEKAEAEHKPVPKEPDGTFTREQELTVVGILRGEVAGRRAFMPLTLAQELFELGGHVHGIAVDLADAEGAEKFTAKLRAMQNDDKLPFDWTFDTWVQRHGQKLAAIQDERVMMWFIMSFVILVAAFSVMNTTITVTVQKRREIGILTALGSRVSQIISIFMSQALLVALTGTTLGLAGGLTVLHFRNDIREKMSQWLGHTVFAPEIYGLSELPAFTAPMDIVIICSVSVVLCLAGAFVPAFFAARVDPAVALRD